MNGLTLICRRPGREARKSRPAAAGYFPGGRHSEVARTADTEGVPSKPTPFPPTRSLPGLAVLLLLTLLTAGCQTAQVTPRLTRDWREAEIAVSNLTAHAWRIALHSPQGEAVKTVEIRPREAVALVVAGGEYTIEQTLFAPAPVGTTVRRFPGRLEAGERYHWTLATLLSAEEVLAP